MSVMTEMGMLISTLTQELSDAQFRLTRQGEDLEDLKQSVRVAQEAEDAAERRITELACQILILQRRLDSYTEPQASLEAAYCKAPAEDAMELLRRLARGYGKIPAIKAYRMRTGVGLKESKDFVEQHCTEFLGYGGMSS